MLEIAAVLLLVALFASFASLRFGIYCTLAIGFLQEPLRKMVPNEPVYVTGLVAVFAFATFVGGKMQHSMLPLKTIPEWDRRLKIVVTAFVAMVLLQCMAGFAYTGSFILAAIGFLAYLSPFPALEMSYSFARRLDRIQSFLWLYVAICFAMALGIYLSLLDLDWRLLQSVGQDLIVYSATTGGAIVLPSGFFRTPEIAAWHCASATCIAIALGLVSRRQLTIVISIALTVFFFGAVLLTGRRKFLVEIAMFLPIFLFLTYRFRLASTRFFGAMAVATIIGVGIAVSGIATDDTIANFREAAARGQAQNETIVGQMLARLKLMTIDTLPYVISQNGILGAGAGSASQGAQYYGGGGELVGASAEGGLGKVLAEVGIPGLAIVFWLALSILAYVWQSLKLISRGDMRAARLAVALTAFLGANGVVFLTAAQAFGDLFVLLVLGFALGFIFAMRRIVAFDAITMSRPDIAAESTTVPMRARPTHG